MATVRVTHEANEQARRLPKPIRNLFAKCLDRLRRWPVVSGAKPLRGNLAGWYRLRMGDYGLRFRVEGDIVTVDKIGHRKDIYED
jgi:mRNA interferase RelE/StbE